MKKPKPIKPMALDALQALVDDLLEQRRHLGDFDVNASVIRYILGIQSEIIKHLAKK